MEQLDFNRIHRFRMDDLNILLNINSGSIHVIDEATWDFMDYLLVNPFDTAIELMMEQYGLDITNDVVEELSALMQSGQLFSDDHELRDYKPHTEPLVKAICLHMAHDCNLRCGYCFADSGAYGGQRSLMSLETGKKALDFLIQSSKHRQHIEVDFFGGEPLLNFDVCKALVAYGKEQGKLHNKIFKFTMTTNGVLLTEEVQAFLNEEGISAVLSLDGRPEVNDRMRQFPNGAGSFDTVVKHFQDFTQSRNHQDYYVRGTYTHHNIDFAADVAHMAALGFRELSMEPVVAPADMDYALTDEDISRALKEYEVLTRHYWSQYEQGKEYHFFHFHIDLDRGPCLPKRLSGCGSGHDYLAISPEGDLYPCHQFVGEEAYKIGTVETGITKPEISKAFQEANVLSKDTCMHCWARFYCSGGCHANNIRYGGSLNTPYEKGCILQKKRLECAIYLQVKKALHASETTGCRF